MGALPEAFGLTDEVEDKPFFPHKSNILENYEKTIELPPPDAYFASSMQKDKYEAFMRWWEQQKQQNATFCLKDEIVAYALNDTRILQIAMIRFRSLAREINQNAFEEPFVNSSTLAGYVLRSLRTYYLQPNTFAILPANYGPMRQNQSQLALNFIKYIAVTEDLRLWHRDSHRTEPRITIDGQHYFVDALDSAHNTVIEVLGDLFHGCPSCFPLRDRPDPFGSTPRLRFQKTKEKIEKLKSANYNVRVFWEHEIRDELKRNKKMKKFFFRQHNVAPLDYREAFIGGRCEVFRWHAEASADLKIHYCDVQVR